jgi:predicted ribosome quality control (RQC) complex YloA/Tae2 family protein
MYFNHYLLYFRIAHELSELLSGASLVEAFTQEKDKLVLCFTTDGGEQFIEICTEGRFPYIIKKDTYARAKKNTVGVFESFLPLTVDTVLIAEFERIIAIKCGGLYICFYVRGTLSNCFIIDENHQLIASFKQYDNIGREKVQQSLNDILFYYPAIENIDRSEVFTTDNLLENQKKFPFLGKAFFLEFEKSGTGNQTSIRLRQMVQDFLAKPFILGIDNVSNEIVLKPESFSDEVTDIFTVTDSALHALHEYIIYHYRYADFFSRLKEIKSKLQKEHEQLKVKLERLQQVTEEELGVEKLKSQADLLAANIYQLTKGIAEVSLPDFTDPEIKVHIPLREDLSPQQNIAAYYKKSKSLTQAIERAKEQIPEVKKKYEKLSAQLEKLDISGIANIDDLKKKIPMNKDNQHKKDEVQVKTIKFLVDGKYTVLVGKDSRNNDILTLKVAKPEDLWFHARGCPGSHVVLQVLNSKEPVQKSTVKKVAAIAAFYSKAKNSGLTPVAYCKKKYVTKRKGMKDGMVSLLREDVLLVRPEIPAGAEYVTPGGDIEDFS